MVDMADIYSITTAAAGLSIIVLLLFNFYHGKHLEYTKIYIALTVAGCFLVSCPLWSLIEFTGSNKESKLSAKLTRSMGQQNKNFAETLSNVAPYITDKKVAEELVSQSKAIIELQDELIRSKDKRDVEKVLNELNTATAAVKTQRSVSHLGVMKK